MFLLGFCLSFTESAGKDMTMQEDSMRIAFRWHCSCLVMMQRYLRYDHIDLLFKPFLTSFQVSFSRAAELTRHHKVILPA
jgi:hypothetical protein